MDPAQQPLQPYSPPSQQSANPINPFTPLGQSQNPPLNPAGGMPSVPPMGSNNNPNPFTPPANNASNLQNSSYPPIVTDPTYGPLPPTPPINPLASQTPASTNLKSEVVGHLAKANNVLVTVSANPSVDQLASAIGLTLVLNKLGKHATAVFSGNIPSTIEFLQPDKTIEKNTDSLRDFIIALDKAKADKLRYKVEDKFVKIFITPYHTSLSESDLVFSQGDFNVDVIVAIGVQQREELDQAITAHGRILHDAVTISVNNKQRTDLGAVNWFTQDASSLCEMLVELIEPLQGTKALLDTQIATAFLTGVVAETERFSNEKTTPHTMNIAATLMKAGANQQLVASKLEIPKDIPHLNKSESDTELPLPAASKDGSLEIEHKDNPVQANTTKTLSDLEKENASFGEDEVESDLAKIHIDDDGRIMSPDKDKLSAPEGDNKDSSNAQPSNMILTPPTIGGQMSSAVNPAPIESPVEPMKESEVVEHGKTIQPLSDEEKGQTLDQLEKSVDSPHAESARQAVDSALNSAEPSRLEPIEALNAQPVDLGNPEVKPDENVETTEEAFPAQIVGPDKGLPPDPTASPNNDASPPPVPPPLMPPSI